MKNLIKSLGVIILISAAYKAGETLWDDALKDKTKELAYKFKKKIKKES